MIATNGKTPRGEGPFMVQFRSGWVSGPFKREQIRWTDIGSDWDAVAVEPAIGSGDAVTWDAKSGGY